MSRRARFAAETSGAAASEFVLILPAAALILVNVVDVASYTWSKMQVDLAAHEAVGAARVLCDKDAELPATTECDSLSTKMTAAAQSTSLGSKVSVADTAEAYFCANDDGQLQQVATVDGTPPADCSDTTDGSLASPGLYISTKASYSFTPIFPGASVTSTMPDIITRTAWLRLQ